MTKPSRSRLVNRQTVTGRAIKSCLLSPSTELMAAGTGELPWWKGAARPEFLFREERVALWGEPRVRRVVEFTRLAPFGFYSNILSNLRYQSWQADRLRPNQGREV